MKNLCQTLLAVPLLCVLNITAANDLFSEPDVAASYISPDGERIALITNAEEHQELVIYTLADDSRRTVFSTSMLNAEEKNIAAVAMGDAVLREVGPRLLREAEENRGLAARLGGHLQFSRGASAERQQAGRQCQAR